MTKQNKPCTFRPPETSCGGGEGGTVGTRPSASGWNVAGRTGYFTRLPEQRKTLSGTTVEEARRAFLEYREIHGMVPEKVLPELQSVLPSGYPGTGDIFCPGRGWHRQFVELMRWPVLCLAPGCTTPTRIVDRMGRLWLHVEGDSELGRATRRDGDILSWATSVLTELFNAGEPLPNTLHFRPSELLRAVGRSTGGRQRVLLEMALKRLNATTVTTPIPVKLSLGELSAFRLIESWHKSARGAADGHWSIMLSPWFLTCIRNRLMLKINPDAFRLGGLERCLYDWGRSYVGSPGRETWRIPLAAAHRRSGSMDTPRRFCFRLKEIVKRNAVPDFDLATHVENGFEFLVIARRTAVSASPRCSEIQPEVLEISGLCADLTSHQNAYPPPLEISWGNEDPENQGD